MSAGSDDRLRFGFALVGLARRWRRALDSKMASLGLTDAAWPPLVHLDRSGDGVSQMELAARCGIDGSTLVRLLDILEDQGLVRRTVAPKDRRSRIIHLTPAGRQRLGEVYEVLRGAEIEMLSEVDDARVAATLEAFDRIDARLAAVGRQR